MTKVININKSTEEGVQDLLKHLLESGKVKAIFTLKALPENKNGEAVSYSLFTSVDAVAQSAPLFPLMSRNAAGLLSLLTQKSEAPVPTAVLARPCELRAFVELVKRIKGNMDNLFLISSTCGGVYPTKMAVGGGVKNDLPNYWSAVNSGEIPANIRPICKGCEEFVPFTADMTILVVGSNDASKECSIFLNTPKAEEFAQGLDGNVTDQELPADKIQQMREARGAEKKKLYEEAGIGSLGLKGLTEIFSKCINCRGCRTACPICYCDLCTIDSQNFAYQLTESEITQKGGMRVPTGTVYYHMTRLAHVTISCVGCGSCEDACPVDIPLAPIFKKVGESVQAIFDYVPGKDPDEEIPLKTFELDELTEVED